MYINATVRDTCRDTNHEAYEQSEEGHGRRHHLVELLRRLQPLASLHPKQSWRVSEKNMSTSGCLKHWYSPNFTVRFHIQSNSSRTTAENELKVLKFTQLYMCLYMVNSQGWQMAPLPCLPPCLSPNDLEVNPPGHPEGVKPVFPTVSVSAPWASPAPPPPHRMALFFLSARQQKNNLREDTQIVTITL